MTDVEWRIEKIVPGGAGFARLSDGRSAFARGALPGEVVSVEDVDDERSYVVARSLTVLQPSADRIAAPCEVAAACGGCDFMHARYDAQLRYKREMLREALTRTGGLRSLPEIDVVASPEELGYRGRIRLQIGEDGRVGFFARDTQELVEISRCIVAAPRVDAAIDGVRRVAARHGSRFGACKAVELRAAPIGAPLSVRLVPRDPGAIPAEIVSELAAALGVEVAVAGRPSSSEQRWPLPGDVELEAPPEAFTQVNWAVNELLVRAVVDGAVSRACRRFCDLYAGAGNFSLALLAAGLSGVSVEFEGAAVQAAQRAAARQGLSARARFVAGDVARVLGTLRREKPFDLVVLDPPRSGARAVLERLIELAPRFVAYSSCDPVTLARDLKTLVSRGYELESVRAFDMFPQTHHFETLVWLHRGSA